MNRKEIKKIKVLYSKSDYVIGYFENNNGRHNNWYDDKCKKMVVFVKLSKWVKIIKAESYKKYNK